jgi:hypothetical protein
MAQLKDSTINGNPVWHAGNDGTGSGLDADTLDGQHGSYYYSSANPPPGVSLTNISSDVIPSANNAYDIGTPSLAWRNIYTNDLHLSNESRETGNDIDGTTGNWTIQEGEENLYIINNKTGKKFKFVMEEV